MSGLCKCNYTDVTTGKVKQMLIGSMCMEYNEGRCKNCDVCKKKLKNKPNLLPCTCYYVEGGPRCVKPSEECKGCAYCNPELNQIRNCPGSSCTSDLRKTEKETKKAIKTAAMAYEASECAAGACSLMGGQSRPSCPRATCERVQIAGRDRVVYVGPRGGRYIKSKGAYVRVV